METIVRIVGDLDQGDRSALERIVGHELAETEQVAVIIVRSAVSEPDDSSLSQTILEVPDWWKIYEGLSDEEVDDLDHAIRQRADLTRDTP